MESTESSETNTQKLERLLLLLAGYELAIKRELRSTRDESFLNVLYSKRDETWGEVKAIGERLKMYGHE